MTIDEALAGEAGLAGVQWVLYGASAQRILHATLLSLLEPPATVRTCTLLRAKVKPRRKLTAYYELALDGVPAGVVPTRAIAVTWTAPHNNKAASLTATNLLPLGSMESEALASGVAAPFRRLQTTDPAWRLAVEVSPLDPTFPQLVRVVTSAHVSAMLANHALPLASPAPTVAQNYVPQNYQITTVRYRPRQRHVLRYAAVPPAATGQSDIFYAKLCQAGEGEATYAMVSWVAEQLARGKGGVTALRPRAWIAADQLLLYPYAPGTPLSHLLGTQQPVLLLLHRAGAALRALHTAPWVPTLPVERKDFAGEVKATLQAGEHLADLAPPQYNMLCTLLERAQERYQRCPAVAPTFTHSDFKADHLLVDHDHLTLIDFDSCALTDPAADVGKFLADLRWWHAFGGQFDLPQAQAAFLNGYGLSRPTEDLQRACLYESIVLAKSTVRRLNLFDDQWLTQTQRLLTQAAQLIQIR